MRTFDQHVDRLMEEVEGLARENAQQRINRAYRTAAEAHAWSFYLKRFTIQTEAAYDSGTVSVTEGGTGATLSGGTWVTSWATEPSSRRMKVTGRTETYDVSGFPTTLTTTLADPFLGSDASAAAYYLYRDEYPLPADCNMSRVLVIYDPVNNRRLDHYNQPEFLSQRSACGGAGTLGTPRCFMVTTHTAENPPRGQIVFFPASDTTDVLHGWYFRRPSFMTTAGEYPDWPAEFEDVLRLLAMIDYYKSPRHYTPRYLTELEPQLNVLWKRMKREFDGSSAIDRQIKEVGGGSSYQAGWTPRWRVG